MEYVLFPKLNQFSVRGAHSDRGEFVSHCRERSETNKSNIIRDSGGNDIFPAFTSLGRIPSRRAARKRGLEIPGHISLRSALDSPVVPAQGIENRILLARGILFAPLKRMAPVPSYRSE